MIPTQPPHLFSFNCFWGAFLLPNKAPGILEGDAGQCYSSHQTAAFFLSYSHSGSLQRALILLLNPNCFHSKDFVFPVSKPERQAGVMANTSQHKGFSLCPTSGFSLVQSPLSEPKGPSAKLPYTKRLSQMISPTMLSHRCISAPLDPFIGTVPSLQAHFPWNL